MLLKYQKRLSEYLKSRLDLNKARATCLSSCILGVIECKSVKLTDISKHLPGDALPKSKSHRLQDFFSEVVLNYKAVAVIILGLLDKLAGEKLVLSIDRTNWTSRGNSVNLLTLSICLGDVGIPIFWIDLRYPGNSNTVERLTLLKRFITFFGVERIACLIGDREFVGQEWFSELKRIGIPFVMRLKKNHLISDFNGQNRQIECFLQHLGPNEHCCLGRRKICDGQLEIEAVNTKDGELLILGSFGMSGISAAEMYLRRWKIEVGFEKLKSHGFNLESTRLQGKGKMERLMSILAIGMAWCYAIGEWSIKEIAPIKIKTHGRKEHSVFRRGLELLAGLFLGSGYKCFSLAKFTFDRLQGAFSSRPKLVT